MSLFCALSRFIAILSCVVLINACTKLSGSSLIAGVTTGEKNLHTFSDGIGKLSANLVLSGNVLYGMDSTGGTSGYGTIFSVNIDGSDYTVLYTFPGTDGMNPRGTLILSGNTLYGTTVGSGLSGGQGSSLFSVNIDGSNFQNLHSFNTNLVPSESYASLVLQNGILYGMMTGYDGTGVIYSIGIDGLNYLALRSFTGLPTVGYGSLTISGNTLYGMTNFGTSGSDTVFSIGTTGSSFASLYTFTATAPSGFPTCSGGGSVIVSGSTLYGTTNCEGLDANGTIFRMGTNGTGLDVLYQFTTGIDGAYPKGDLTLSGTTLYGMTSYGGKSSFGNIFSISTTGTGFSDLYDFTNGADGSLPTGGLVFSFNALFGTSSSPNSSIFSFGL